MWLTGRNEGGSNSTLVGEGVVFPVRTVRCRNEGGSNSTLVATLDLPGGVKLKKPQ